MKRSLIKEFLLKDLFIIKEGRIRLFKNLNYIMYPTSGVILNFQKVGESLGEQFLYELGYEAGISFRQQVLNEINTLKKFLPKRLQSLFLILSISGQGSIVSSIEVEHNPGLVYGYKMFKEKSLIPKFYSGFYSAVLGKSVKIEKLEEKYILYEK